MIWLWQVCNKWQTTCTDEMIKTRPCIKMYLESEQGVFMQPSNLGSSSLTTDLTKDKNSSQKYIQAVGFQQLCSFYRINRHENISINHSTVNQTSALFQTLVNKAIPESTDFSMSRLQFHSPWLNYFYQPNYKLTTLCNHCMCCVFL